MPPVAKNPFSKPFSWSYSKLKNYESCPTRHLHLDLLKDVDDPPSEQILWGNQLHDALAAAIETDDNDQRRGKDVITPAPLPPTMASYQPWVDRFRSARKSGAYVYTEMQFAITRSFTPTLWFAGDAWYRAKVDVLIVTPDGRFAAAYDWKTGQRKEDSVQLMLTALALMVHRPAIEAIRTEFVWLKEMKPADPYACVDRVAFKRHEMQAMWSSVAPRVRKLETAWDTRSYPAQPSGLCRRWCAVNTCEHHGR